MSTNSSGSSSGSTSQKIVKSNRSPIGNRNNRNNHRNRFQNNNPNNQMAQIKELLHLIPFAAQFFGNNNDNNENAERIRILDERLYNEQQQNASLVRQNLAAGSLAMVQDGEIKNLNRINDQFIHDNDNLHEDQRIDRQYIRQLQSNEQTFRMWATIFSVLFIGLAFYYWNQTNQMQQDTRRQIEIENKFAQLTGLIRNDKHYHKEQKFLEIIKQREQEIQMLRNRRHKSDKMTEAKNRHVIHQNDNDFEHQNYDDDTMNIDDDDDDMINRNIEQIQADVIDQIEKELNKMRNKRQ
ncbi:hypothetical protein HUG17_3918 [Dermatophagoides farinae]|uniref:Transmembrane protein n=1 Tax=Dermatophagoides farinae TaxID=6954 RepID=A0A9D4NVD1_DERFA|nr:bromodomain-containing protein DDB_G0280777-like [Dermatophagoides farinae]KAH7639885.1 hypothetical protein HUG17_3918 [Dermatophagoides farinae]